MQKEKNVVLIVSLAIVAIIAAWGIIAPVSFESTANLSLNFLVSKFGWFYAISMTSFVVFSVWIALSRYGKIKLGADDSKPDYSFISWFAMLFSAGMGIGLVFWGVAEPMNHFVNPMGLEGGTAAAADFAIRKSFFHWGLHPWANYSVLALALAYMQFRKDKPGLISSVFIPLLGEKRVQGGIGKTIDILAVFATVAGVATSLGLGAMQINSGLNYMFGIPENNIALIAIVVIITCIFMLSAAVGLDKGMKFLSNLNVALAGLIAVIAIIIGPTSAIFSNFTRGMLLYSTELVTDMLHIQDYMTNPWYGSWTIFYWAWWIAWAPFVGTFIARISRGRTIREFVAGVLLAPSIASFLWFAIFGTMGINTGLDVASEAIKSTSTAFFVIMNAYPMGTVLSLIAVGLLCTFFVTSADSATFVLGMLTSKGDLNPTRKIKLTWGIIQSILALALMLFTMNGLGMLQTISIVAAFPFSFIMVFAMVSIFKALKSEDVIADTSEVEAKKSSAQ